MIRHLDLFSGIGGFARACQLVGGIETVAFCEIDPFCQRVLEKNFPGVPIWDDVTKLPGQLELTETHFPGTYDRIDLITGGYPCQPFSVAGRQKAKQDPRHLWPHMRDIIEQVGPAWVLCENVFGHIKLGLDDVLHDLEDLAYSATAFVIPSVATGTRHNRERLYIVAHTDGDGLDEGEVAGGDGAPDADEQAGQDEAGDDEGRSSLRAGLEWRSYSAGTGGIESTEIRVDDGLPDRMDRCKSLGNAIDPRIAAELIHCMFGGIYGKGVA